jgi:hypothetical protein
MRLPLKYQVKAPEEENLARNNLFIFDPFRHRLITSIFGVATMIRPAASNGLRRTRQTTPAVILLPSQDHHLSP